MELWFWPGAAFAACAIAITWWNYCRSGSPDELPPSIEPKCFYCHETYVGESMQWSVDGPWPPEATVSPPPAPDNTLVCYNCILTQVCGAPTTREAVEAMIGAYPHLAPALAAQIDDVPSRSEWKSRGAESEAEYDMVVE